MAAWGPSVYAAASDGYQWRSRSTPSRSGFPSSHNGGLVGCFGRARSTPHRSGGRGRADCCECGRPGNLEAGTTSWRKRQHVATTANGAVCHDVPDAQNRYAPVALIKVRCAKMQSRTKGFPSAWSIWLDGSRKDSRQGGSASPDRSVSRSTGRLLMLRFLWNQSSVFEMPKPSGQQAPCRYTCRLRHA